VQCSQAVAAGTCGLLYDPRTPPNLPFPPSQPCTSSVLLSPLPLAAALLLWWRLASLPPPQPAAAAASSRSLLIPSLARATCLPIRRRGRGEKGRLVGRGLSDLAAASSSVGISLVSRHGRRRAAPGTRARRAGTGCCCCCSGSGSGPCRGSYPLFLCCGASKVLALRGFRLCRWGQRFCLGCFVGG